MQINAVQHDEFANVIAVKVRKFVAILMHRCDFTLIVFK